jgi:hypothetical protein
MREAGNKDRAVAAAAPLPGYRHVFHDFYEIAGK